MQRGGANSRRDRMVASAALVIRERGAHAAAISEGARLQRRPTPSAYHYFPVDAPNCSVEAIDFAAEFIASRISNADTRWRPEPW